MLQIKVQLPKRKQHLLINSLGLQIDRNTSHAKYGPLMTRINKIYSEQIRAKSKERSRLMQRQPFVSHFRTRTLDASLSRRYNQEIKSNVKQDEKWGSMEASYYQNIRKGCPVPENSVTNQNNSSPELICKPAKRASRLKPINTSLLGSSQFIAYNAIKPKYTHRPDEANLVHSIFKMLSLSLETETRRYYDLNGLKKPLHMKSVRSVKERKSRMFTHVKECESRSPDQMKELRHISPWEDLETSNFY